MAQTELHLDGLGIRKIVETPPGVKVLSISGNRLRSLGSIAACVTLEEINLAANKLNEDALAPLAALPALRVLNISRNHVRDLGPLFLAPPALAAQSRAFPALEVLNISANAALNDITAAMSLQVLRSLTATGLNVTSLHCVHCSLEVVDLRGCCLQTISLLKAVPYLSELMLDGNALLSCKDLLEHPMMQTLRLAHNAIEEISAVQLPSLTELDLASNNISQALHLAGAPRLVSLVVRGNQLTSLVPLSPLRSLTFLDASQNQIRALEPSLRWSVRPLRVLLLNGNEITDVEDVAQTLEMAGGLSLEHLDLRNNPLSIDLYPFADKLPTWTWEASASLEDLISDGFSSVPRSMRDRYWQRLCLVIPSLQSLDGILRDPRRLPTVTLKQEDPSATVTLQGADGDEVMYCTPRRSTEATAQDFVAGISRRSERILSIDPQLPTQPLTVDTADAATSPVFREHGGSTEQASSAMSTEALLNLGLAPELLGEAQRKARREAQPVVLAMEVAAAAAAAAVSAASTNQALLSQSRRCGADQATEPETEAEKPGPQHVSEGGQGSGTWSVHQQRTTIQEMTERSGDGQVDEAITSSQGSFLPVVDLSACAGRGPLPGSDGLSAWAAASQVPGVSSGEPDEESSSCQRQILPSPAQSRSATATTLLVSQRQGSQGGPLPSAQMVVPEEASHDVEEQNAVDQEGLVSVLQLEDAFLQKGTEFEKQQLMIVEKLERAHEDLARQWQELDNERRKSTEQQQQQRQLLAREQAELAQYFKDFEAEMERRYSWQQQQKQEFEEQWHQELAQRRQTWEHEQEKERSKLQQCFHELEEQLQSKIEVAQVQADDRAKSDAAERTADAPADASKQAVPAPAAPEDCRSQVTSDLLQPKLDPHVRARLLGLTPRQAYDADVSTDALVTEQLSSVHTEMVHERSSASAGSSSPVKAVKASGMPVPAMAAAAPTTVAAAAPMVPSALRVRLSGMASCTSCASTPCTSAPCTSAPRTSAPCPRTPCTSIPCPCRAEERREAERREEERSGHRLGGLGGRLQAEPLVTSAPEPSRKVSFLDPPGSNGAFLRALQGQGIWEVEGSEAPEAPAQPPPLESLSGQATQSVEKEDLAHMDGHERDLKITASLDESGGPRVVSSAEAPRQNGDSRQAYLRFLRSEMLAQQAYLREIKSARQANKHVPGMRPAGPKVQLPGQGLQGDDRRGRLAAPQAQVLRQGLAEVADFSKRVPAQSSSQLRHVKVVEPGHVAKPEESSTQTAGADPAWHCMVTPVNAGVRGALEALIAQQAWSVPGKALAYTYSLGRAIQNITPPARQRFDATISRDSAREGLLPPLGFSQRAFFYDASSRLSEVISSPFGFGAVYKGRALLFALELRQAERLCQPRLYGAHAGRVILAEIALGRCHTARCSLQEAVTGQPESPAGLGGSVPLANVLEEEYRRGADSVYFPKLAVVALLCPARALPVFLAEYSRKLVGQ